jgi:gamma-glutamyltranspeptidase
MIEPESSPSTEISPTVSASSYQNEGEIGESSPPSGSGRRFSRQSSRRSSTSRRGSILQAVRRAFSIDAYQQAESDDGSMVDDDDEEFRPIPHADEPRELDPVQWRWIGVAVLALLFFASITFTAKSGKIPGRPLKGHSPSVGAGNGICGDPVQTLRSSSMIEGLEHGAVAADHPLCSEIGTSIMREKGGNAIDAAVATALCLGVANPASSGIGGGAFMLIHADPAQDRGQASPIFHDARSGDSPVSRSGKVTEVIDAREVAPSAATTEMYLAEDLLSTAAIVGGLGSAVPAELRGLELAHSRHGRLPWADVVEPAMILARDGVKVNANLAHEILLLSPFAAEWPNFGLRALLTKRDNWNNPLKEGDILKNPKLGATLQAIMEEGSDALYKGERAAQLARDIQDAGGIITKEDIENYHATLRSPVVGHDINGFSIVGVGPPSSGGAAVIGAARFLANYTSPLAAFADALSSHRMVEACKHMFSIRMSMSDPAYNVKMVADAVNDMIEGHYISELRQATKDNETLPLSQYGGTKWAQLNDTDGAGKAKDAKEGDRNLRGLARRFGYLEDHGTSHFSVVDKDGNAVAMTSSVNTYFGSQVISASTGIIVNNQMDDFANPGNPNFFGLRPSEANYIKPGKKPLSSMSPTMVFRTSSEGGNESLDNLRLVIGASGGPKIITAVLQVILNHVMMGRPLFDSIVHPRLHDQLIYHDSASTTTEHATLEQGPLIDVAERTRNALTNRGHRLLDVNYLGTVQAIAIDLETNALTAACDVRKGGSPAGY